MQTRALTIVAALTIALLPPAAQAQHSPASTSRARADTAPHDPPYRYRLLGVYDDQTGDPIEGVDVTDVLNGNTAHTTPTGTVSLYFLPDGGSLVRVRKMGYGVQTMTIPISPADTTPMTILLTRVSTLPTVVTRDSAERYLSPLLRGFEQRKAQGFGSFIDEAEMRKDDNWTMANVLTSHLSGITTAVAPHGAVYIASSRKMCSGLALASCRNANCYPSVYVDGVRFTATGPDGINGIDFSKWSPTEFAAAEFHSSLSVPAQFAGTDQQCGVLLLWTRER